MAEKEQRDSDIKSSDSRWRGYPPNHPWHYLPQGDAARPVAANDIPASTVDEKCVWFVGKLPKDAAKRDAALHALLSERNGDLAARIHRYDDIRAHGVSVLSAFDRQIAYGNDDDMAFACTMAMLFNQIAELKGQVAWLRRRTGRQFTLFD